MSSARELLRKAKAAKTGKSGLAGGKAVNGRERLEALKKQRLAQRAREEAAEREAAEREARMARAAAVMTGEASQKRVAVVEEEPVGLVGGYGSDDDDGAEEGGLPAGFFDSQSNADDGPPTKRAKTDEDALPAGFFDGGAPAEEAEEKPKGDNADLPTGFFDNKEADAKAHGIDLEAEMNATVKTFEDELEREQFEKTIAEVKGELQDIEDAELEEVIGEHRAETGAEMSEFAKRISEIATKVDRHEDKVAEKAKDKKKKKKKERVKKAGGATLSLDSFLDFRAKATG